MWGARLPLADENPGTATYICESKYFNVYFELDKEMIYETVNDG